MAAPGAQEVQIKPADLLQYGTDTKLDVVGTKRQDQVIKLRHVKEQKGGREFLSAAIDYKDDEHGYRHEVTKRWETKFGAGAARYDEATNNVTEPVTAEKKAIFQEAKALVEQSATVLSYLEIANSKDPNITFNTLKTSRPELAGLTYDQLKDKALDFICDDPAFVKMFPETAKKGAVAKRIIADATFTHDTRFRARLETRMEEAYAKAEALKDVVGGDKEYNLEQEKKMAAVVIEERADDVAHLLRTKGLKVKVGGSMVDATKDNIKQILATATNKERADDLLQITLLGCSEDDYQKIKHYRVTLPNRIQQLDVDIKAAQDAAVAAGGNRNIITNPIAQSLSNTKRSLELELNKRGGEIGANPATLGALSTEWTRLQRNLSDTGLKMVGATSVLDTFIDQQVNAQKKIADHDKKLAELKITAATSDEKKSERDRLIEESRQVDGLKRLMSHALVDTMQTRYDDLLPAEQEAQAEAIQKAEEDKKTELALRIKMLGQNMEKRWMLFDKKTRSRTPQRKQIKADMQSLIYEPNTDEQIKRMMMRDAGIFDPNTNRNLVPPRDAMGQELPASVSWQDIDITTGVYVYEDPTTHEKTTYKVDLSVINDLFTSQKDAYLKKLFKGYGASRGWRDVTVNIFGQEFLSDGDENLALKEHEWVLLEQKFGTLVEEGIKSSDAKQVMDNLRNQGIIPDFKMKWLLYLLLITGGLVTGGLAVPLAGVGALGAVGTSIGVNIVAGGAAGIGIGKVADAAFDATSSTS